MEHYTSSFRLVSEQNEKQEDELAEKCQKCPRVAILWYPLSKIIIPSKLLIFPNSTGVALLVSCQMDVRTDTYMSLRF